jgi:virulence factor Mce-like protein
MRQRDKRLHARQGLHPFVVGVLVIVTTAVLMYLAFHGGLPFQRGYRVSAILQSSNQLRPGSPVRVAGLTVGAVKSVDRGPGQTTKVTMQIGDQGRPIHRDATVRVRPRLFLEGGFYVELHPGSPSAPEMADGGTIPLPQTSIPVQFSQVLSTFDLPTRDSVRRTLYTFAAALAHGGAAGLRAAAPVLGPSLRDIARTTRALQGTEPHDVSTGIASASRVTAALAHRDAALAGLVDSVDVTASALASSDAALGATIRQLDRVLVVAPAALSALGDALPSLRRFGVLLDPGLRAAPPVLDDVSHALRELGALVEPAQRERLLAALRASLRDLPTLIDRVGELFPVAKPVTDCLTSHGLPLLTSQVPDGALSSGRPVWQDFAHGLVGLASASQNFDGNGYSLRYLGGGGNQTLSTGSLPVIGSLVGSSPGSGAIVGARPSWLGPGVVPPFRPDQACSAQPLPNLQAATAPSDLAGHRATRPRTGSFTLHQLEQMLVRAARRGRGRR